MGYSTSARYATRRGGEKKSERESEREREKDTGSMSAAREAGGHARVRRPHSMPRIIPSVRGVVLLFANEEVGRVDVLRNVLLVPAEENGEDGEDDEREAKEAEQHGNDHYRRVQRGSFLYVKHPEYHPQKNSTP